MRTPDNEFLRRQKQRMDELTFDLVARSFVRFFPWQRRKLLEVGDNPKSLDRFVRMSRHREFRDVRGKVIPVHKVVEPAGDSVVAPWDALEQFTKDAVFRAILPYCACRAGMKCNDYPVELGCIFVGRGAENLVRLGFAREASAGEAMDHYKKGRDLGLAVMMAHVGPVYRLMGMTDHDAAHTIETCMCCPCCCVAYASFKSRSLLPEDARARFEGLGYRAVADEEVCNGCRQCAATCPAGAMAVRGAVAEAEEWCLGCGVCLDHCPEGALRLERADGDETDIGRWFEGRHM